MPQTAESLEATKSRFVVGIDLGTTNSAVAFVDTLAEPLVVRTFQVPQVVAPGQVEALDGLPSFHLELPPEERAAMPPATTAMGTGLAGTSGQANEFVVGHYARERGSQIPGRLVSSAKSWLCHRGVDRTAAILPWHPLPEVTRLSPVEVSARLLAHIRQAWDQANPEQPLATQDVVLTLPASFDEIARELTIRAAQLAGLPRLVLLEEPQAAFYAWIETHKQDWSRRVTAGQKILVCDIGGGTTDFTLIRVRPGSDNKVQFHRVAVGEHLILGGDNLDLALAVMLESRLSPGHKLEGRAWGSLVQICRRVKETLLGKEPPETYSIHVPGTGSKLIGGAKLVEVTRAEVVSTLVDGFLPFIHLEERPQQRGSGFQEFGLPFAPDPAMTRYLAAFLLTHQHTGAEKDAVTTPSGQAHPARPDLVLFNGGLFESPVLRTRMLQVLSRWFTPPGEPDWLPTVLENQRLDLAVAHGAAYYGLVRRGLGVAISAGLPRSYYLGVGAAAPASSPQTAAHAATDVAETAPVSESTGSVSTVLSGTTSTQAPSVTTAVCLAPVGLEPGHQVVLDQLPLKLLVKTPVEFPLFVSSTRATDRPGDIVTVQPEEMSALPPMRTVLQTTRQEPADTVQVTLHCGLTEIGTLDLSCHEKNGSRRWRLVFDVRSTMQTERSAHANLAEREGFVDESQWDAVAALIRGTFEQASKLHPPEGLMKSLEQTLAGNRWEWPSSLLRRMADLLTELEECRKRSAAHETRWLNLLGFTLRPGYGLALDDWRVDQVWKLFQKRKLVFPGPSSQAESLVLWRRLAGGLSAGQQRALADQLLPSLRGHSATSGKKRDVGTGSPMQVTAERWRLAGALELLSVPVKVELGQQIGLELKKSPAEAVRGSLLWALARLGARVPLYGPLNTVVPPANAEKWLQELLQAAAPPGKASAGKPAATSVDAAADGRGSNSQLKLAVMQLARKTNDRYRDLSNDIRRKAAQWLKDWDAPGHYISLITEGGQLEREEQGLAQGDRLPRGLMLAE